MLFYSEIHIWARLSTKWWRRNGSPSSKNSHWHLIQEISPFSAIYILESSASLQFRRHGFTCNYENFSFAVLILVSSKFCFAQHNQSTEFFLRPLTSFCGCTEIYSLNAQTYNVEGNIFSVWILRSRTANISLLPFYWLLEALFLNTRAVVFIPCVWV